MLQKNCLYQMSSQKYSKCSASWTSHCKRGVEYAHGFPACRMRRLKGCPDSSASTAWDYARFLSHLYSLGWGFLLQSLSLEFSSLLNGSRCRGRKGEGRAYHLGIGDYHLTRTAPCVTCLESGYLKSFLHFGSQWYQNMAVRHSILRFRVSICH